MMRTTPEGDADVRPRMRSSDIVVDDERLSMAAKGAFLTVTLLGNGCRVDELARHCLDDTAAVERALHELERLGYVHLASGSIHIEEAPRFGIPET